MGDVVVTRACSAPVERLWQVVTDWAGHDRFFPLTSVRVTCGAPGVGQRLEATTRLGPARLRDPMVVTRWEPPGGDGLCELRKVGRVLGGRAILAVEPSARGSLLRWTTDVGPASRRARHVLAPVSRLTGTPLYRHVVNAMVREAERD